MVSLSHLHVVLPGQGSGKGVVVVNVVGSRGGQGVVVGGRAVDGSRSQFAAEYVMYVLNILLYLCMKYNTYYILSGGLLIEVM